MSGISVLKVCRFERPPGGGSRMLLGRLGKKKKIRQVRRLGSNQLETPDQQEREKPKKGGDLFVGWGDFQMGRVRRDGPGVAGTFLGGGKHSRRGERVAEVTSDRSVVAAEVAVRKRSGRHVVASSYRIQNQGGFGGRGCERGDACIRQLWGSAKKRDREIIFSWR